MEVPPSAVPPAVPAARGLRYDIKQVYTTRRLVDDAVVVDPFAVEQRDVVSYVDPLSALFAACVVLRLFRTGAFCVLCMFVTFAGDEPAAVTGELALGELVQGNR